MKWLRRLLGTDFPNPEVGQVWRCTRNGEFMRVARVRIHSTGGVFVTCENWNDGASWGPAGWGIGDTYAHSLSQWRHRLREESRVLVGVGYEPWPPTAPVIRRAGWRPIGHVPPARAPTSPPRRTSSPAPAAAPASDDWVIPASLAFAHSRDESPVPTPAPAPSFASGKGGDYSGGGASGSWGDSSSSSSSSCSSSDSSSSSSSSSCSSSD